MRYGYMCGDCMLEFEEDQPVDLRDLPTGSPCPRCGEYSVERMMGTPRINVPVGNVGNAENGYSSTHGDSENFKAGRKVY